jgi:uncharacterized protein YegL
MYGEKIDSLNYAVSEMIRVFSQEDIVRAEIHVAVITFGGQQAIIHQTLKPAKEILWGDMTADGMTPMGGAFTISRQLLEDREQLPIRAYTPTIVLVSDGQPNDSWQEPLQSLLNSDRAKKAVRLAMGIGEDAEPQMLEKFIANPEIPIFMAHQTKDIHKFFKFITFFTTQRSRSVNPNQYMLPAGDLKGLG